MASVLKPVSDEEPLVDFQTVTPINNPEMVASASFVSTDLARMRAMLEQFMGLECVRHKPGGMLVRDRGWQPLGHRRGKPYWALEIFERDRIEYPQVYENHWGMELSTPEEVDRAHVLATRYRDRFGFSEIRDVRDMHGNYGFYCRDFDSNWWEIEFSDFRARQFLGRGGFGGEWRIRTDAGDEVSRDNPAITPWFLSHGTIECGGNGNAARTFYAEFLGIGGPLREGYRSGGFITRRHWYVACLNVDDQMRPQPIDNRWILAFNTPDEVRGFHDSATEYQARYRIREIQPVVEEDGALCCRIRDLDGNWFEAQYRDATPGRWFDSAFERGDVE